MPKTTQLDPAEIDAQATRHEATSDNIIQQLNQLKSQVDATLAGSNSAATKALSTTCDNWIEGLKRTILANLTEMAGYIRKESQGQDAQDQAAGQEIARLPMETSSFLGA
ncbi:hypothetical protein GCM10027598_85160 [Amycolatopsis oliviviridis]|uniref:WXG100 family type VII secretion target n=1 Tax=Amycolatopsis oliviviridis TaxID=1471590 RepID=A0ABQ3L9T9_9PSEU|nr:hypothetical protein [Amycolatopsis oliviviridis]GHH07861.1 hypothetical protein GCM10017790_15050 [Amycolatopsis oliviviridis]